MALKISIMEDEAFRKELQKFCQEQLRPIAREEIAKILTPGYAKEELTKYIKGELTKKALDELRWNIYHNIKNTDAFREEMKKHITEYIKYERSAADMTLQGKLDERIKNLIHITLREMFK
jgi:hypothetical protein